MAAKVGGGGKGLTSGGTEDIKHPDFAGKSKNLNVGKHDEEDIHVRDVEHSSEVCEDGTPPPRMSDL